MENKFILQGVTRDSHLDELRDIFTLNDISTVIISVAFLNQRGFGLLEDLIRPIAEKTIVLAGIRNGITSAQGLIACVECGCKTYAVDTGSRNVIYHPKIYLARNDNEVRLVLGSANLTAGGLHSNIEASLKLTADLGDLENAALFTEVETKINEMIVEFPDHVIEIKTVDAIRKLLAAKRLADESFATAPSPSGLSGDRALDYIPQMRLKQKALKLGAVSPVNEDAVGDLQPQNVSMFIGVVPVPELEAAPPPLGASKANHPILVWKSKELTRRTLNIPEASGTNPTGSMFFTKGLIADIDQRHFFREKVFADLDWQSDTAPGKEHLERAIGNFRVVIKNVDYGVFGMHLTHDSRKNSRAYQQRNSMTQLHWGEVAPLVTHEDLLGRTMYLYQDCDQPNFFVLEID